MTKKMLQRRIGIRLKGNPLRMEPPRLVRANSAFQKAKKAS